MWVSRFGGLTGLIFVTAACSSTHLSVHDDGHGDETGGAANAAGSGGMAGGGTATGGSAATGGLLPDPEPAGCPAIACLSRALIRFPISVSLAEAVRSSVKVCRNDECYEGTWKTTEEPTGDTGAGIELPDYGDHPERRDSLKTPVIIVTLWNQIPAPSRLEVQWMPWSDGDLKDGDRYRVEMTNAQGRALIRFDRQITYAKDSIGGVTCPLSCAAATVDVDVADECPGCAP